MVTTVISNTVVSATGTHVFGGSQDALIVTQGAGLIVTGEKAVSFAPGAFVSYLLVDGSIVSGSVVHETVLLPAFSRMQVGTEGVVRGIANSGFATVIMGADIVAGSGNGSQVSLINHGEITAAIASAVILRGVSVTLNNSGDITGGQWGVLCTDRFAHVVNDGMISATFGTALNVEAESTVINGGVIQGPITAAGGQAAVVLGGGGSLLRNSGGSGAPGRSTVSPSSPMPWATRSSIPG